MVSLPPACRIRRRRSRTYGRRPSVSRHCARSPRLVEVVTVAPPSFPTHRDRRPSRRQCFLGDNQPAPQHRESTRLGEPLTPRCDSPAAGDDRPALAATGWGQLARAQRAPRSSTSTALPMSATWAAKARIPSWYWSSTARVIAPAHRDDDTAVMRLLTLRPPRRRAFPIQPAQPHPIGELRPVHRPRNDPILVNAAASASVDVTGCGSALPPMAQPPPDRRSGATAHALPCTTS